jgi:hypothetical protein
MMLWVYSTSSHGVKVSRIPKGKSTLAGDHPKEDMAKHLELTSLYQCSVDKFGPKNEPSDILVS